MLKLNAEERPTIDEVFNELRSPSAPDATISPEPSGAEMCILNFTGTKLDAEYVKLEWEVINAQEVRIDNGFPLVKKGSKKLRFESDAYVLKVKDSSGKIIEKSILIGTPTPPEPIPTGADTPATPKSGGGLRGPGLRMAKK
jgi:hypothetical protein